MVPDPGDPTTTSTYPDTPTGYRRFYGRTLASTYQLPTVSGATVTIDIPGPDGGPPSWSCDGCADRQTFTGDAAELSTMGSAGIHAVRCGRDVIDNADAEIRGISGEAQRVDPKAAGYLQVAGILASAGFAVLASTGGRLPGAAAVAGTITAALVLAAVVLLLLASRPHLGGGDFGFMAYAGVDVHTVLARLTHGDPQSRLTRWHKARELAWRSNLLRTKYTRIRWSVPLLVAGFVGAAVTAGLAVWAG